MRSEGNTGGVEFMFLIDETEEIPGNAFSYYYTIEETVANGKWFRLSIPLTRFESQDKTLQDPWRNVGAFFIYPSSELKEFYIDDIRIRKTID